MAESLTDELASILTAYLLVLCSLILVVLVSLSSKHTQKFSAYQTFYTRKEQIMVNWLLDIFG